MSKTIVGVFGSYDSAEMAATKVKDAGLRTDDISIIGKDRQEKGGDSETSGGNRGMTNDNINRGVTTGTTLGGVAGLLLGLGTIAIPGLGVVAAAGPIAGLISGAITGGIVGGLIDLGIPQEASKEYENDVKSGKVIWTMGVDDSNETEVSHILQDCGGSVSVYNK